MCVFFVKFPSTQCVITINMSDADILQTTIIPGEEKWKKYHKISSQFDHLLSILDVTNISTCFDDAHFNYVCALCKYIRTYLYIFLLLFLIIFPLPLVKMTLATSFSNIDKPTEKSSNSNNHLSHFDVRTKAK